MLRGSAVTGQRWKDGAPFDADGPGTSDLDLTLVGSTVIHFFKVTGFFVPGSTLAADGRRGSRHRAGAGAARQKLMAIVKPPGEHPGVARIVLQFRGDLLDQPYLTLLKT